MLREIRMKVPRVLSRHLGSRSDLLQRPAFKDLDSWPPDQKYPCSYNAEERTHRAEQNPFWVLSPESMRGGPIKWIATNGSFPHDKICVECDSEYQEDGLCRCEEKAL
jgi:hypothetical protein